jgi:cell division protein FtsB
MNYNPINPYYDGLRKENLKLTKENKALKEENERLKSEVVAYASVDADSDGPVTE